MKVEPNDAKTDYFSAPPSALRPIRNLEMMRTAGEITRRLSPNDRKPLIHASNDAHGHGDAEGTDAEEAQTPAQLRRRDGGLPQTHRRNFADRRRSFPVQSAAGLDSYRPARFWSGAPAYYVRTCSKVEWCP